MCRFESAGMKVERSPGSSEFPTLESGTELGPLPLPTPALCQLKRGPVIISDKKLEFIENESKGA